MPGISNKLKALGVSRGINEMKAPPSKAHFPIDWAIDGKLLDTEVGQTFLREQIYPYDYYHGNNRLIFGASLYNLATLTGNPDLINANPSTFIFLDTETSGLAGGTGTYVFLVGIGRYEEDGFHLRQYFLREPGEEKAHLAAILGSLLDSDVLVTYNGKAFDAPLINTRFILHNDAPPFKSTTHIDLLPIARRLWRDWLSNRRLGNVERQILNVNRTQEDIPGWMIPSLYFDYLQTGDARPLRQVFYHNAMDILSLAALMNHISRMFDNPQGGGITSGVELVALGKIFEDLGQIDDAARCYSEGLACDLPSVVRFEALRRWSLMEKRRRNIMISIELWQEAAANQEIYAYEELAKVYEHHLVDIDKAIYWTETALRIIQTSGFESFEQPVWYRQLEHRLERLKRKAR
jgi:uncharacterized protein YprB with RNaseH-like and TPR domain